MASKGPKSDVVAVPRKSIAKPVVPAAAKPTPVVPVAAKPLPAVPQPVIAQATPVVAAPEPVVPAPVTTAEEPKPAVAAEAPAPTQKETPMETIQSAAETAQARAQTLFTEANDRTKAAMEKGAKLVEELNDFSKGNVEAIVESSKIAAKGIETLGQEAADYSRKQFESATAALKTLSTVKSPTDFLKLHSDYMRSAFDSMVAETSKNTETMLKLAGEIAQPISNRVALAAEKMKIAA